MNSAELAILSLIVERPHHGYEIESVIEQRGMREWTEIGFSSIYYLLRRLESAGLIQSRLTPAAGQGPARRVYAVTPEGRQAWESAVLAALADPTPAPAPLQIGLAGLIGLPRPAAREALAQHRDQLRARREHVLARAAAQETWLPWNARLQFDYSLRMIDAELGFLDHAIDILETLPETGDVPPEDPYGNEIGLEKGI